MNTFNIYVYIILYKLLIVSLISLESYYFLSCKWYVNHITIIFKNNTIKRDTKDLLRIIITTNLSNIYRKLGTGKPWAWHCRPILAFRERIYAEIFVSVEKLGDFIPIGSELYIWNKLKVYHHFGIWKKNIFNK